MTTPIPIPIPIDLAQITWTRGDITRFEVAGTQGAKSLLRDDSSAAITVAHRAEVTHLAETGEVAIFLYLDLAIGTGTPPQPSGISGRFEMDFIFTIGNLPELLVMATDQPEPRLHPQLLLMLTSVAYSTARGILWTRLAGTPLEGITLPLVNPAQLLQPAAPTIGPPSAVKKPRSAPARPRKSKPAQ